MAYENLQGRVTADGRLVAVFCKRCGEVHAHERIGGGPDRPIGDGDGYRVAGCNRPGGYAGYVVLEVGRLSEEQERRYEKELLAATA
jgi:hypothetical protein